MKKKKKNGMWMKNGWSIWGIYNGKQRKVEEEDERKKERRKVCVVYNVKVQLSTENLWTPPPSTTLHSLYKVTTFNLPRRCSNTILQYNRIFVFGIIFGCMLVRWHDSSSNQFAYNTLLMILYCPTLKKWRNTRYKIYELLLPLTINFEMKTHII